MSTVTAKATTNATSEAQIRELLDGWLQAVHNRDTKRIMTCYAPDVVAFDAIAALQFKGVEAYGKHWEACLSMCTGPMVFQIHELNIEAEDDVAFADLPSRHRWARGPRPTAASTAPHNVPDVAGGSALRA